MLLLGSPSGASSEVAWWKMLLLSTGVLWGVLLFDAKIDKIESPGCHATLKWSLQRSFVFYIPAKY